MRLRVLVITLSLMAAASLAAACGSGSQESTPATTTTTGGPDGGQDRMIGYRLKRLDQLIESTFDRLLGTAGLTRRQWQTLNTLTRGPQSRDQLIDALRPFWEVNNENLNDLTDDLVGRGWAQRQPDGTLTLTAAGTAATATAEREVGTIRDIVAKDIGQDEFSLMMDVLQRMTHNLEADAESR
ncbi:MarR family transcriptional regulator [Nocardia sp. NPDC058058]|uniref:MarR family transcriptional regulator n=1 Tax=Nocardia sp. NPDC058058 TaxID=3346317 RepID=UPI0036DD331A